MNDENGTGPQLQALQDAINNRLQPYGDLLMMMANVQTRTGVDLSDEAAVVSGQSERLARELEAEIVAAASWPDGVISNVGRLVETLRRPAARELQERIESLQRMIDVLDRSQRAEKYS